jgi:preprotein translocase SecE subunit
MNRSAGSRAKWVMKPVGDASNALEHAKGAWQQFEQYASEVKTETKRVTWPSMQEVYGTTVMVVLTTFLFGIYFYLCDLVLGEL